MKQKTSLDADRIRSLTNVALGTEHADLVISSGDLVNVYTGELLKGWSVAIKGERIAYVGNDVSHTVGPETKVIDASGKTLIPGLIDGHTHLLWWYSLEEFLKYAMRGGTTTIITETLELAFPLGIDGITEFLEIADNQPIKIFATAPPMPSLSPIAEALAIDAKALKELLQREEILGLGEMYWSSIIDGNDRIFDLFAETLAAGKKLEGHSAGARGNRLAAYMAAGISSCHESTTVEEALERMRMGIHTMIREGDIRMELPVISRITEENIDFRRLILVTDGVGPRRLMSDGYMEFVVQRAIDFGFDPIVAIQMATLNVAEHFSIDDIVGGIAPGKYADIVVIPDPKTIRAEYVVSKGNIIAHNKKLLIPPRKQSFSQKSYRSIEISRKLEPADFAIHIDSANGPVKVRVMDMVTDLVSRETHLDVAVTKGEIKIDTENDILKIAIVTTDGHGEKQRFTGLVRGFGIKKGAFASSAAWDTCAMIVVGANEQDMAEAINRIVALKGGIVVCADGKVQAELPLPVGGAISDQPIEVIVQKLEAIQEKMSDLGCSLADAHLSLTVFASPAIPFLRICEKGLADIRKGEIVDLVIS
ncbi:MAG: adenine deaminase C-terminal domain-containing protein [Chloroflexota bacterium]|nr:adenine deaminase C-terminal domain-containing protein [Chloroflexota bacterium]